MHFNDRAVEKASLEAMPRFTLTLSQKALVLVAVPLVFELVFVAVLGAVLEQSER